ncbi:cysteine-rich receptor-like protein kinase 10 [Neltuma alba]|uniref:cysteine-rich receptor-like protein kinase 10 n=1 Tax=Neltuma alba TaxID=207710 RepID=UPI0010A3CE3A|nr:cysteine-rich receptor-like protein kinase 10 [Prosopis alba]
MIVFASSQTPIKNKHFFNLAMITHRCFLLFFFFISSFLCSATIEALRPTYLYHNCSTAGKSFSANSTFQSHRTTLLSSLASANAAFYNATVPGGSEAIYGLFMCRGDVSLQVCRECVANATQLLPSECRFSKEAVIWYDECMLRYSNTSFFSTIDKWPTVVILNPYNISNSYQARFKSFLLDFMNETASMVAVPKSASEEKAYAKNQANFQSQTVYSLAQCTPDLRLEDCRSCLSGVIGNIPLCSEGKIGGRAVNPSCNIRYEMSPPEAPAPAPAPAVSPALTPPFFPRTNTSRHPRPPGRTILVVVASAVVGGIIFYSAYYLLKIRMKKSHRAGLRKKYFGTESTTLEHLQFNLATIEAATNRFSHENSLGRGGFGQVFKGILLNGQEIAVKRLSKGSGQGAEEFKNEVLLIARLQHRNLVALLGFCIEEQEKILVYEYVPNRSLDYFLFGSQNSRVLDWMERSKIIGGVARGILYLHEYSRLKIIHRDLKPSNILLDDEMNPKISDFGLAKMVAISENEGSTNRIVGTYGYMSPEYAMFGQYSEKSDVFSFGVIVLEIISGKKNTGCHDSQYADGLLSYTWKQWRDDKLLEILDSNINELGSYNEVIKCIQIGLLCVQENPNTRPSMATVVSYLSNDSIQLPSPQEPAFFLHGKPEPIITSASGESCSVNEASMSEFFPR